MPSLVGRLCISSWSLPTTVTDLEDAIAQWCHQGPWRPLRWHFCAREAPGVGGSTGSYCRLWCVGPGTLELTPHVAIGQ
jgi:hypothetical protein